MSNLNKSKKSRINSCWRLAAVALAASLAGTALAAVPGSTDNTSHVWRVPDDAVWELISGRGEVEKATDGWVWRGR